MSAHQKVLDFISSQYKIPAIKKIESIRKSATSIRDHAIISSLIQKKENLKDTDYEYISIQKQKELFQKKVEYFNQDLITISMEGDDIFGAVVDKLVSLYSQSKASIDANIPKGVDAIKYMVVKKVTKILLGDGFEVRQVDATANTTIDPLALTKKRKNKYGLEMTELEQELDDIKLGLNGKYIEKYQGGRYEHPEHGKEDAVQFFNRVYGKYKQGNCIFQDDLLAIDRKLYIALENLFNRKNNRYGFRFSQFLHTSSSKLNLAREKISKLPDSSDLSYFGSRIKSNTI